MVPLKEACQSQEPILEQHEVNILFGPIERIISCHELFYLALSSKTTEWDQGHTIGDCILSSVSVALNRIMVLLLYVLVYTNVRSSCIRSYSLMLS